MKDEKEPTSTPATITLSPEEYRNFVEALYALHKAPAPGQLPLMTPKQLFNWALDYADWWMDHRNKVMKKFPKKQGTAPTRRHEGDA